MRFNLLYAYDVYIHAPVLTQNKNDCDERFLLSN